MFGLMHLLDIFQAQLNGNPEAWKHYWLDPMTKLVNFIGKDNIPFHASIFPAMIMGQNTPYKIVDELPANEFYNLEGRQFSKSDGWYIDLEDFFKRYTVDQIRYTISANAPETSDSEFTWKDFQTRCNSELLGKFGNLVNRVLVFTRNRCQGCVPGKDSLDAIDTEFLTKIGSFVDQASGAYQSFKLRRASQIIMELAQQGNIYFDSKRPWQDASDPQRQSLMETTVACCFECLKALALISYPIMPQTANEVWTMMGYSTDLGSQDWHEVIKTSVPKGQHLPEPKILFQRVEDEHIQKEIAKLHKLSQSKVVP
jgi:methionyl-tRNA synthetase